MLLLLGFFLVEIDKLILKFIWEFKGPKIARTILKKENKGGRFKVPDLRLTIKTTEIKTIVKKLEQAL